MNSLDLAAITLRNLLRRKVRTALTVMGVVIGTASIIIMVSIGIGMNEGFKEELSQMGSLTMINVRSGDGMYMMVDEMDMGRGRESQPLDEQAAALFAAIPGVETVIPTIEVPGMLTVGKYQAHVQLQGIDPAHMDELNMTAGEGRLLQREDNLGLVFGAEITNFFYNPTGRSYGPPQIDLMKDRMNLSLESFHGESGQTPKTLAVKGVGILAEGGFENDYSVFMAREPLTKLVREHNRGRKPSESIKLDGYSKVQVRVGNINDVQRVQEQIKDEGFFADSLNDILESMQNTTAGIQQVLGAIGIVSLLVAAIGITNTMVMSIYERTREIGVMKVIGASLRDIRRLFLFESGMIGLLGGIAGVLFSYGVSYVLNSTGFALFESFGMGGETKASIVPLWLSLSALVFSSLIGLIAGYFPARRAMKLSALEAIKNE